jgi:hypothetical protein
MDKSIQNNNKKIINTNQGELGTGREKKQIE